MELAPAVADMLAHAGLKADQLKALGVAIGPGSFTSLRVGISFIKGLALALGVPMVGINTLDVVAASQPVGKLPMACLLPAGRGRLAVGWYDAPSGNRPLKKSIWQARGPAIIMTIDTLSDSISQECVACGDLSAAERQTLKKNDMVWLVSPALGTRRPGILAELAYARWQAGAVDDISSLAPLYLHLDNPIPADSSLPTSAASPA